MAAGSHSTWPEWAPRTYDDCGKPVRLGGRTARGAIFRLNPNSGRARSLHADCGPHNYPRLRNRAERRLRLGGR